MGGKKGVPGAKEKDKEKQKAQAAAAAKAQEEADWAAAGAHTSAQTFKDTQHFEPFPANEIQLAVHALSN
jgi:hypothetical protein